MQIAGDARLHFDMADRLRRALRVSNVSVQEMADYLDVTRGSVSNWINGRIQPDVRTLRLFAMRTGFPVSWLVNGEEPPPGGDDSSFEPPVGIEPTTFSLQGPEFVAMMRARMAA
jgi:transcriptional regulator with XRE-family HTH domain